MTLDPRKRQKKVERRNAKQKQRRQAQSRQSKGGIAQMQAAAKSPVLHCVVTAGLMDEGMGQVLLSRALPNREVAVATFLIDRYCLGVKDAMVATALRDDYDERLYGELVGNFGATKLEPSCARKLVEGAVEYARQIGLSPHPDFHKAKVLFGDLDASACATVFEYGRDGRPFFIPGPYDDDVRCASIIRTLNLHCGPEGFGTLVRFVEQQ